MGCWISMGITNQRCTMLLVWVIRPVVWPGLAVFCLSISVYAVFRLSMYTLPHVCLLLYTPPYVYIHCLMFCMYFIVTLVSSRAIFQLSSVYMCFVQQVAQDHSLGGKSHSPLLLWFLYFLAFHLSPRKF